MRCGGTIWVGRIIYLEKLITVLSVAVLTFTCGTTRLASANGHKLKVAQLGNLSQRTIWTIVRADAGTTLNNLPAKVGQTVGDRDVISTVHNGACRLETDFTGPGYQQHVLISIESDSSGRFHDVTSKLYEASFELLHGDGTGGISVKESWTGTGPRPLTRYRVHGRRGYYTLGGKGTMYWFAYQNNPTSMDPDNAYLACFREPGKHQVVITSKFQGEHVLNAGFQTTVTDEGSLGSIIPIAPAAPSEAH